MEDLGMDSIKTLGDLKLNSWLIRQCQKFGVKTPTEIQKAVIPHILNGEDCIGCAKTGSGKTLAFALPILQKWCEDPFGIFALILTPTRELAYQIGDQFIVLGKPMNLRVSIITGGIDMVCQGLELSTRPHIVIATPGRLADHMDACNTFSLARIKYLVLDEADRLLGTPGGNFDQTLRTIFAALPLQKQTLLFSATMTDTLEQVKSITKNKVFVWEAKQEVATVEELDQYYVLCPYDIKDGYLVETVRLYREKSPSGSIVIFTDTCRSCQVLCMMLNDIGLHSVPLHGSISQRQRLAALSQFKSNQVKVLVATDVASRGLDIAGVELVVNYNIPPSPKDYVHRVGRTARAGRYGNAISLVTPYDIQLLKDVEDAVGAKLEEFTVNGKKVSEIYMQVSVTRREAELKLDEAEFDARKMINKRKKLILAGKSPEEADEIIRTLEEKKKLWLEKRKSGDGGKERQNPGTGWTERKHSGESGSGRLEGGRTGSKNECKILMSKFKQEKTKVKGKSEKLKGKRGKMKEKTLKPEASEEDPKRKVHISKGYVSEELKDIKKQTGTGTKKRYSAKISVEEAEGDEEIIEKNPVNLKKKRKVNVFVDATPVKRKSLGMVWNEYVRVEKEEDANGDGQRKTKRVRKGMKEVTKEMSCEGIEEVGSNSKSKVRMVKEPSDLRFVEKKSVSQLGKRKKGKSKRSKLGGQETSKISSMSDFVKREKKPKRNAPDLDEIKDLLGL